MVRMRHRVFFSIRHPQFERNTAGHCGFDLLACHRMIMMRGPDSGKQIKLA